jgi:hypothetical protein
MSKMARDKHDNGDYKRDEDEVAADEGDLILCNI